MNPSSETPKPGSDPGNSNKPLKKSGWQQGLTSQDLDTLRQGTTVVKSATTTTEKAVPRAIVVSPVEFARLAALLAQQYGKKTPPQRYFRAADELIRLADKYLNDERAEPLGKRVAELEMDLNQGWVSMALACQNFANKPHQKGLSLVGTISTPEGLKKALQRLDPTNFRSLIERRTFRINGEDVETDAIHETTISRIREYQQRANERRGQRRTNSGSAT